MRRLLIAATALLLLTGTACTPQEVEEWVRCNTPGNINCMTPEEWKEHKETEGRRHYEEQQCAFYGDPEGANLDYVPGDPTIDCSLYN